MNNRKIALLVDVDNVKIGGEAFNELYAKLNEIGDVVYCKFYGYNDRKHIYLSDAIARYGYETAPFMRYKKRFSQLDNRIIVDAIKLNYTKTEIDTYCLVVGDGDLIPLLVELKSCGRFLIDINSPYYEQNTHMFDAHIMLTSLTDDIETYVPKTKKTKKVTKKRVEAPIKFNTEEEEYVAPKPAPITKRTVRVEEEEIEEVSQKLSKAQANKRVAARQYVEEEPTTYSDSADVSEVLNDIVERYNELDFTTNADMGKKVQLIKDIEAFVNRETAKGEGLKSDNEDIRQIFVDLKNIADDMKNAINN
ncbi:MAG: NYN domain-containing protein [Clostridiales bacterium]|nr:NYN domain-containing protein [Clostridiales bacterium]